MYIYNPQDLCLLDSLPWFFRLGYDCIRIEAGKEGPEYVKTVTAIYRQALDSIAEGDPVEWEDWKEQLEQYSPQGVTKGHYYRGVL
jgi:putative protease